MTRIEFNVYETDENSNAFKWKSTHADHQSAKTHAHWLAEMTGVEHTVRKHETTARTPLDRSTYSKELTTYWAKP